MPISEDSFFVNGNLGRDWERKEITAKGQPTVIYTNSVAYQESKDGPTTWVNLTVWPDRDGGESLGQAVAEATGKGSRVITRGPIKYDSYVSREGESKASWSQNVWGIGAEIRGTTTGQVASQFAGATVASAPAVPKSHEPF